MDNQSKEELQFLRLAMYMYKTGLPIMTDTEFDSRIKCLEEKIGEVDHRWDNISEEEGHKLMEIYGLEVETSGREITFPTNQYVKEEKAKQEIIDRYIAFKPIWNQSMPIVQTDELITGVLNSFTEAGETEIMASLKVDGWNVTIYIENGEIVFAHTRGRQAEAQDITSIMQAVLPNIHGKIDIKQAVVVGELYLEDSSLNHLRQKYNKPFKTTRNSVSTFIANKVTKDDMSLAKFGAFHIIKENKSYGTYSEMFSELGKLGFDVPNWAIYEPTHRAIADLLIDWGNRLNHLPPSDGITIRPNNIRIKEGLTQLPGIVGSYEVGLYALKMGAWGDRTYQAIVEDITHTRGTKSIRPSLKITPTKTNMGRTVTTIPVDHIGRLVDEDIFVGKQIRFRVVSEQDIQLVYDKEIASYRV